MADTIAVLGMPFLACLLLATMLGVLGLHVVKREIVFVDIAMAQIAAVGTVLAHLVFKVHDDSILSTACSLGMVGLAAVFFATARQRLPQVSLEAIIGVTYAVSAGAALFMVGIAPGGHMHMQKLLSGNLLWISGRDLLWLAVVFAPVFGFLWVAHDHLTYLGQIDVKVAPKKTFVWEVVFYSMLGLVITLGVRVAGIVVVFAFLVIPATLSLLLFPSVGKRLLIVWLVGIVASGFGLTFAYQLDFSVGPSIALFLGLELILVALIQRLVGSKTF